MGAIAVHHTDTTDAAWDANANLKRLGDEPGEQKLRAMHAWVDPDGDAETKAAYKFPHHMVSSGGEVGAANTRACSAGIAVLNGARGGADIPSSDRQGVYSHLAAHLRDADMEPPELRSASLEGIQRRTITLKDVEVRSEAEPVIRGYAAVFNQWADIIPGVYRERIAPGAFKKTLKEADVRALFNHNPDYVLGRNKAGTLSLSEDEHGLAVEIRPPDTQWARDLMTSMKRGDISQMSFAFSIVKYEDNDTGKVLERTLIEAKLYDVSVVTFPAYPQTEAWARSAIACLQRYLEEPGNHSSPEPSEPDRHSGDTDWQEAAAKRLKRLEELRSKL